MDTSDGTDVPTFPRAEIEVALKREWAEQSGSSLKGGDPFAKKEGGTVMDIQPAMDSLTAVTTLLVIEEFVPFDLPDQIVMKGGYFTGDQYVDHLLRQTEECWDKHYGIHTTRSTKKVKDKKKETVDG